MLSLEFYFADKLCGSKFGSHEDIVQMTDCFDKTTKHRFRNPDEPSYIKFGAMRDKDTNYDIRSGQLKLPGWVNFNFSFERFLQVLCSDRKLKHFLNRRLEKSSMRSRNNVDPLTRRSRCVHNHMAS